MKKKFLILISIAAVAVILLLSVVAYKFFGDTTDSTERESGAETTDVNKGMFDGTYTEGLIFLRDRDTYDYIIVDYVGKQTEVVIPTEYNGSKVSMIAEKAFFDSDIESVQIPDSVTVIASNAFLNSKSLKSVYIGEKASRLEKIGKKAFSGCNLLEAIYFIGNEELWCNVELGENWDQNAGSLNQAGRYELFIMDRGYVIEDTTETVTETAEETNTYTDTETATFADDTTDNTANDTEEDSTVSEEIDDVTDSDLEHFEKYIDKSSGYYASALPFGAAVDFINGYGKSDQGLNSYDKRAGLESGPVVITLNDSTAFGTYRVCFAGWSVIEGGFEKYVWSADGGKTWYDAELYASKAFTDADKDIIKAANSLAKKNMSKYGAASVFYGSPGRVSGVSANLKAYAGEKVNVTFAMVPKNEPDKLTVVLHVKGVAVPSKAIKDDTPFDAYFGADYFADKVDISNNKKTVANDGSYVKYTRAGSSVDGYHVFIDSDSGDTVNGKYLIMKYRTDHMWICDFWANSHDSSHDGGCAQYHENLTTDGKWHILIIDLEEAFEKENSFGNIVKYVDKNEYGEYELRYLRIDVVNSVADEGYMDIAYVALCEDLKSAREYFSDEDKALCPHPVSDGPAYVEGQGYVTICAACGEQIGAVQFNAFYTGEDLKNIPHNWSDFKERVGDDKSWWISARSSVSGERYLTVPVENVKGRYIVIKYRASVKSQNNIQIFTNTITDSPSLKYQLTDYGGYPLYKAYYLNEYSTGSNDKYLNSKGQPVADKSEAEIIPTRIPDGSDFYNDVELIIDEKTGEPIPYEESVELTGRIPINSNTGDEWQIVTVDLDELIGERYVYDYGENSGFVDAYDPNDYIQYLRLDIVNEASYEVGDYIDIAYIGICDNVDFVN